MMPFRFGLSWFILLGFMAVSYGSDTFKRDESRRAAIRSGLAFLARQQNADGSYGTDNSLFGRDPAVTALCGLAFLASGSTPGRGEYGDNIDRALRYILSCARPVGSNHVAGLIAGPNWQSNKPMYGHGYATLFLAECYGMTDHAEVKEKLIAAVDLIVAIQNAEGGWRYDPYPVDLADISVTICQISALAAARDAGIFVPDKTMTLALDFVAKCQNENGGFRYMLADGKSGFGRTAAAIFALQVTGLFRTDVMQRGKTFLADTLERWKNEPEWSQGSIEYFHYAQFYAASAFWIDHSKADQATLWEKWSEFVIPKLLKEQCKDGSWPSNMPVEATTAMVLCALAIDRERLPVFTR